ncbi:MAG: aminotransferase class I/II-fold pyridoxal phosphate-dependent enzyme [Flavobacteriia bacterium]|nr:aminotransferase class I/II-fold pyridoxal phosphate-dependent enzyme [Flavobacteriia bacterium]
MAKINHTNYLDVVDTIFSSSKQKGLTHINSNEKYFDGKKFEIDGKELINFGTCGYLGLENHPELIKGSIDLLRKYGTQFSMGRVFMRPIYIRELEELMGIIFNNSKVLCYTSTSTAHISVISTIIKPTDLIVLDQQVHFSVQFPCKHTKLQGTEIKMIRHSNFDMLETILKEESNKYQKVWYMADGVYSMHGDFPDIVRLQELLIKYPKLHLYFDDAHGMGWSGKNGAGYVFDKLGVSERIVLISTMAKGFGCVGGTAVFSSEEMYRKVDIFGGPHSYSHPLTPASVGAAIASAKIHLSNDIYNFQNELFDLTSYMDDLLCKNNLPNLSAPNSPIYFIGSGLNKVTHNFVNRILKEGYYVNTATFPAVPNDKSGLRFTVTRHVTKENIKNFVDVLAFHFPKAIEEENDHIEKVFEVFNLEMKGFIVNNTTQNSGYKTEVYNSIRDIDRIKWDLMFDDRGNFSYEGMCCMEEIFTKNEKLEHNWSFHYVIIRNEHDEIVLSTFFTGGIYKDDMLAMENVSKKIEEIRSENDPYYLCSKTLSMGSLFAEGNFIYLKENENVGDLFQALVRCSDEIKTLIGATTIIFRDFEEGNKFDSLFEKEGFLRVKMPNSNRVENPKWESNEDFLRLINSSNNRRNIKRYVLKNEDLFEVNIKNELTESEAEKYFELFENVKDSNFAFNFFKYPSKITTVLSNCSNYEFIDIKLKDSQETICSVWCFKGKNHYSPFIMGINYDYLSSHHLYKQAMFQIIKRSNELNRKIVYLGFSADYEKQKYGSKIIPTLAYIKVDDTYNMELIESFSNAN